MTEHQPPSDDGAARVAAVDVERSVIVQAPAGSGKTTLLVERYLNLLAIAEAPEEILAITFTRKAAGEMRARVLKVLAPDFTSDEAHEQGLVKASRRLRPKIAQWRLLEQPQRLMIRTIDSFNRFLTATMPVATQLGPVPTPAEDSRSIYRQAARRVLDQGAQDPTLRPAIGTVLQWLDNNQQRLEELLIDMLGQRERWLQALAQTGDVHRDALEDTLAELVRERLAQASTALASALARNGLSDEGLRSCIAEAAQVLVARGSHSPVTAMASAPALPDGEPDTVPGWRALAEVFLTGKDTARTFGGVNKNFGFDAQSELKARFAPFHEALCANTPFIEALAQARKAPAPRYSDAQWAALDALVTVLRRSATELELLFARLGETDYVGLAAAALHGLGDEEHGYTDLGLYLDRRIRHILVDEFQDTNWTQFHLLEKLTAGWEPGDGRTLFAVGDPMQSIYRFREAEVGLFLRARDEGIGSVVLEPLTLTQNFRSRPGVVDWVNTSLALVFPEQENVAAGAIRYTPSAPARRSANVPAVQHIAAPDTVTEGEQIATALAGAIADARDNPHFRAAVIVRSRSHLKHILPALNRHGLRYRAVALDPLLDRPVAQDLLALTRVLSMPANRTALLAVLRGRSCGLTLTSLLALAEHPEGLLSSAALAALPQPERDRAEPVRALLEDASQHRGQLSLRAMVEGAWQRLGGLACCADPAVDARDAQLFLDTLESAENAGALRDWNDFLDRLGEIRTEGDPPSDDVRIEVLTVHGAKGLEWDLVVLPGLHRKSRGADTQLLHWLPFTDRVRGEQMLLAPLRSASAEQDKDPLISLIHDEQRRRDRYETQRLLYVATTRAREQLLLSATLEPSDKAFKPVSGALLAELWQTAEPAFLAAQSEPAEPAPGAAPAEEQDDAQDQLLHRVADRWRPPAPPVLAWEPALPQREPSTPVEYDWAGLAARLSGTVLHRLLERVGQLGAENLTAAERARLAARVPTLLRGLGVKVEQLDDLAARITEGFEHTLDTADGQWLLSCAHQDAGCEVPLTGLVGGELVSAIIDRTFVDRDGNRWIVDYKSGRHEGGGLDHYLAEQADRYRGQLERYRALYAGIESRPTVTALYLPMHGALKIVSDERSADHL
jgi:ATP-dependent exoDNAse (exonuclease V) beta subunit